ncbi:MAG: hypothetical protein MRERV_12c032 [Mycoplasmataceae bacterium RV_VA103A]|nr:MAG: hypothetical protein MRERV_12c032 [Mycoplasmataceae bacterium RV_VA103A]
MTYNFMLNFISFPYAPPPCNTCKSIAYQISH